MNAIIKSAAAILMALILVLSTASFTGADVYADETHFQGAGSSAEVNEEEPASEKTEPYYYVYPQQVTPLTNESYMSL